MPGIIDIKRRITSIQSMRKITRAMQLVSAAKMGKAQSATLASRTYSSLAWELISSLSPSSVIARNAADDSSDEALAKSEAISSEDKQARMTPLLATYPQAKKIGVVLLSTNKGLVGSLNLSLSAKIKEVDKDMEVLSELMVYGKKGKQLGVILNKNILADFPKVDKTVSVEDVYPIAQFITESYKTGQYRQILIIYNHFVSTLVQKPTIKQLLPFTDQPEKKDLPTTHYSPPTSPEFLFEPTPTQVLEHLLPRIIESQIYQAILESDASEHSARMIMMKNATDAAGDLITDLTLTYNQIRQNKITTELAEITAGKIALE